MNLGSSSRPAVSLRDSIAASGTLHLRHLLLAHPKQAAAQISTICGKDDPEKPALVAKENDSDGTSPGNPDNIEHVLSQALSGEILTRGLEGLGGGVILGSSRDLENILADECRDGEETVQPEGAG